jgi:hypothetical protein
MIDQILMMMMTYQGFETLVLPNFDATNFNEFIRLFYFQVFVNTSSTDPLHTSLTPQDISR